MNVLEEKLNFFFRAYKIVSVMYVTDGLSVTHNKTVHATLANELNKKKIFVALMH